MVSFCAIYADENAFQLGEDLRVRSTEGCIAILGVQEVKGEPLLLWSAHNAEAYEEAIGVPPFALGLLRIGIEPFFVVSTITRSATEARSRVDVRSSPNKDRKSTRLNSSH